jgi:hypothetical protein
VNFENTREWIWKIDKVCQLEHTLELDFGNTQSQTALGAFVLLTSIIQKN